MSDFTWGLADINNPSAYPFTANIKPNGDEEGAFYTQMFKKLFADYTDPASGYNKELFKKLQQMAVDVSGRGDEEYSLLNAAGYGPSVSNAFSGQIAKNNLAKSRESALGGFSDAFLKGQGLGMQALSGGADFYGQGQNRDLQRLLGYAQLQQKRDENDQDFFGGLFNTLLKGPMGWIGKQLG